MFADRKAMLRHGWHSVWILLIFWPLAAWRLFRNPIIPKVLAVVVTALVVLPAILLFLMVIMGIAAQVDTVHVFTLSQTLQGSGSLKPLPPHSYLTQTTRSNHFAGPPLYPGLLFIMLLAFTVGPYLFLVPWLGPIVLSIYLWQFAPKFADPPDLRR